MHASIYLGFVNNTQLHCVRSRKIENYLENIIIITLNYVLFYYCGKTITQLGLSLLTAKYQTYVYVATGNVTHGLV